ARRDSERQARVTLPLHLRSRVARVRSRMTRAGIDALAVTHLPNVQYLTGFVGTAGAVLVLGDACVLVVDFRYVTAANALSATVDGSVRVETAERSYDETIVEVVGRAGVSRIGIE